jgi:hypothetical protein
MVEGLHEQMVKIEDEFGTSGDPLYVFIANLLGVEATDEFMEFLVVEVKRAKALGDGHYSRFISMDDERQWIALGLLQGVTLARAVLDLRKEDERGGQD